MAVEGLPVVVLAVAVEGVLLMPNGALLVRLARAMFPKTFPGFETAGVAFDVSAMEPKTFPVLGAAGAGLDDNELKADDGLVVFKGAVF